VTPDEPPFRSLSRGERRERILKAAKHVLLERGLDEASMDDVAARAGTTKPTVYAHFQSKDELFAAVVEYIRGLFCGRFVELTCWRDAVGYQRVALAAAGRSPIIARAVYDTLFAEACRSLAGYLGARKLTRTPNQDAELVLAAATGGPVIRHLFGVDDPCPDPPDVEAVGARVDMKRIREAVKLFAARWTA